MTTTTVSTKASDPGSNSRAFPWPVLEIGNDSFPEGEYAVTCKDKEVGKSFELRHEVQGAPLIELWRQQNKLDFVCTVASPRSMYRTLHKSDTPVQVIAWDQQDLGEYPMFTPMIVARQAIQHTVSATADGLNQVWDGREISLPRGARIAIGHTFKFRSDIHTILDFNLDDSLDPGRFRVQASHEDGFKFKVHLATDLYQYLRHRRKEQTGRNIMVHIISAALALLHMKYSEDNDEEGEGWQSHRNLVGLADLLEQKNLMHWSDEDFQPEYIATGLYQHIVPVEGTQE